MTKKPTGWARDSERITHLIVTYDDGSSEEFYLTLHGTMKIKAFIERHMTIMPDLSIEEHLNLICSSEA